MLFLCSGAIIAEIGTLADARDEERNFSGEVMMVLAVAAAACKYVFAKVIPRCSNPRLSDRQLTRSGPIL